MRNLLLITCAAFLMNLILACGAQPTEINEETALAVEVDMKVEGMVCAMGCAKFIEDEVAGLDGVLSSSVDFETETAHFELDQNILSPAELEAFIDDIHDGQYQAEIVEAENKVEIEEQDQEETVTSSEEEISAVHERFQITIPGLLSYFLKSLR